MTSRSNPRGFLSSWLGRLYIAAVAIGSLAFAVWLFTFIGNGGYNWRIGVTVAEASLRGTARLGLRVNADCTKNSEVSRLVETDVDVQVEVVADATPFLHGVDCGGSVGVQLQEPLGDRAVVDMRTGEIVIDASSYTGVSVVEARLRDPAPDRLVLYVSSCNPVVSRLVETDVDVQVEVIANSHASLSGGQDCRNRVAIWLQEPLGDRAVVDMRTGEIVRLRPWGAGDDVAEMPDVAPPEIGDAPNQAELEDLQFIADQEGISLETAIERYGWHDNFSLAVEQIREASPAAFSGAEIVDDSNAWIAFDGKAPQEALDILNTFRSSHSWVSVQIRTGN